MTLEKCLSFFFPDNKLLRFTTKINYASKPGSLSSKSFCSLCISAPSNTKSCKKPTPPPNANLRLASQALREWFSNGERVYYQCNPGYSQTGFSIQRCSKGQWMPAKSLFTCIGQYLQPLLQCKSVDVNNTKCYSCHKPCFPFTFVDLLYMFYITGRSIPLPFILVKKEEITQERKASRASKTKPPIISYLCF